MSLAFDTAIGL